MFPETKRHSHAQLVNSTRSPRKEAQKFGRFAHVKHPCQGTMAAHGPEISKLPGHIGMADS